jgi:hypothetical protein
MPYRIRLVARVRVLEPSAHRTTKSVRNYKSMSENTNFRPKTNNLSFYHFHMFMLPIIHTAAGC